LQETAFRSRVSKYLATDRTLVLLTYLLTKGASIRGYSSYRTKNLYALLISIIVSKILSCQALRENLRNSEDIAILQRTINSAICYCRLRWDSFSRQKAVSRHPERNEVKSKDLLFSSYLAHILEPSKKKQILRLRLRLRSE
jgi:hypothetical protein